MLPPRSPAPGGVPTPRRRLRSPAPAALIASLMIGAAGAANATVFQLTPMDFGDGYALTGTIRTDGATGALSAADIVAWNLKVTAITDIVYTPANTINVSSNVTSTGSQLLVPTFVNGSSDGGSLAFRGGHYFQVQVADFTGANTHGGQAFYVAGSAFDFLPLHQPNGANYVAANVESPGGNVFDLVSRTFPGGEVMSGAITTTGAIGAAQITDWTIRIRAIQKWTFTRANSQVWNDFGIMSDGVKLTVTPLDADGNPGGFSIGSVHFDFNGVLLGDFTYDPGGVAGYISPFVYQTISPLPLDANGNFVVGLAAPVPEPSTWSMLILGFAGFGAAFRARRRASVEAG